MFDFGDVLNQYNRSESGEEADRLALEMDLEAVADDLRTAIARFEDSHRLIRKR